LMEKLSKLNMSHEEYVNLGMNEKLKIRTGVDYNSKRHEEPDFESCSSSVQNNDRKKITIARGAKSLHLFSEK
jgi:phage tail tube protein FII